MKKYLVFSFLLLIIASNSFAHPYYNCKISDIDIEGQELSGVLDFYFDQGNSYIVSKDSYLKLGDYQSYSYDKIEVVSNERLERAKEAGYFVYNVIFKIVDNENGIRVGEQADNYIRTGIPSHSDYNYAQYMSYEVEAKLTCEETY